MEHFSFGRYSPCALAYFTFPPFPHSGSLESVRDLRGAPERSESLLPHVFLIRNPYQGLVLNLS